jgi:hypothetical protein
MTPCPRCANGPLTAHCPMPLLSSGSRRAGRGDCGAGTSGTLFQARLRRRPAAADGGSCADGYPRQGRPGAARHAGRVRRHPLPRVPRHDGGRADDAEGDDLRVREVRRHPRAVGSAVGERSEGDPRERQARAARRRAQAVDRVHSNSSAGQVSGRSRRMVRGRSSVCGRSRRTRAVRGLTGF